jgi:hypothetical protein
VNVLGALLLSAFRAISNPDVRSLQAMSELGTRLLFHAHVQGFRQAGETRTHLSSSLLVHAQLDRLSVREVWWFGVRKGKALQASQKTSAEPLCHSQKLAKLCFPFACTIILIWTVLSHSRTQSFNPQSFPRLGEGIPTQRRTTGAVPDK